MEKLIAIRLSLSEKGFNRNKIRSEISGFAGENMHPDKYLERMLKLGYLIEKTKDGKPHYRANKDKLFSKI